MAVSSLFGAAASFFYAVSTLLNGAQNNVAIQRSFVDNFDNPSQLVPISSSLNNVTLTNPSAIPSTSSPPTNYNAQFTPTSPNPAFRPIVSTYSLYGSESSVNVSATPPVDFYTLFPDLAASIRAGSGRMMLTEPIGISYYDGETIATVYVNPNGNVTHCDLLEVNFADEQLAALKMLATQNKIIEKIGFHAMLNLIKACQSLDVTNENPDQNGGNNEVTQDPLLLNPIDVLVGKKKNMWSMISGILPGTKWCGLKDIAEDYNDLGSQRELDKCCRSHDLCPRKVLAFRSAYGLVNWSLYSKSHCECDSSLYDCLKRAAIKNPTAELVGNFYFNVLRAQCIDEENPTNCLQYDGFSCIKWENDNSDASRLFLKEVRRRFR
ncbi:Acidic phospholipase A2 PA4 [Orchesella cincta]|uniref:phospholipase A2 n=1 Tax=Orchesella cincta TaxID=48709 RepID=A0A1D2NIP4_ORCCI|nr:Acidic phospholipase A2 PA4 [Orchesella cincta]